MKILYVITGADIGGAQKHLIYLTEWFMRDGHQIHVVTGEDGPLTAALEEMGVSVTMIPIPRTIKPFQDLKALFRLCRFILRGDFDVIHSHSSKAGILARLAGFMLRVRKNIFTAHGFVFTDPTLSSKKRLFYVWLERICSWFATDIITVSQFDFEGGVKDGINPRKMHVIVNGLPKEQLISEADWVKKQEGLRGSEKKVIGFVGRFASEKNIDMLIRVAALFRENNFTNVEIWALGEGPLFQHYKEIIGRERLDDMIILKGNQDNVLDWMDRMHALVITSHKEGLPYVLLEAIGRGLPVISTDVGGVKEVLGTRTIVPINDDLEMYELLREILMNDDAREEIGRNLLKCADQITVDKMCVKLKDIYK